MSAPKAVDPVAAAPRLAARRHLWPIAVVESLVSLAGAAGALQLVTGTYAPPVTDLTPLGLTSWVLPGLWLFASVAVPSALAAWLAWRASPAAPVAALVAAAALLVELAVQLPFVGPSALQAVLGAVALAVAALAWRARAAAAVSRSRPA